MENTELPGLSGPLWTITMLVMLLGALAVAVYLFYINRKR